ncbi:hypothetical protein L596_015755 [Steinernema carpocapsae]|uniref:Uncharacterized protein n=1 Tax=Steinernema carpocapsae TaxID=34508 RepID=A0A4U5NGS6_STECR|nr:hypothetical protein L596_015755 [Steinernema carpocapsae]
MSPLIVILVAMPIQALIFFAIWLFGPNGYAKVRTDRKFELNDSDDESVTEELLGEDEQEKEPTATTSEAKIVDIESEVGTSAL